MMINKDQLRNDCNFLPLLPAEVHTYMIQNATPRHQYVTWLHFLGDNLIFRTWAYRCKRYDFEYTEVERKLLCKEEVTVRKNIYLTPMSGYHPVYTPQVHSGGNWYGYTYYYFDASDFDIWYCERPMGLYTHILNVDELFKHEEFQYCGFSGQQDLFSYLLAYKENPKVEYFGKMKLKYSKSLMHKIEKDKQFIHFLKENVKKVNLYGSQISIYAYDHKISFEEAEDYLCLKRTAERATSHFTRIKDKGINRIKIYEYAREVGFYNYRDYWEAIVYLGLDLTDTKNTMPKDFQRMHDLRIDEYGSKKASEAVKSKRELARKFKKNVGKYKQTEICGEDYCIIIPNTPHDLVKEGKALHHCVGRMGYDKKVAEGKSLIGFVRLVNSPETPFVTVEYLVKEKRISQVYGDHDSRPPEEVIKFANKWCEVIKKNEQKEAL